MLGPRLTAVFSALRASLAKVLVPDKLFKTIDTLRLQLTPVEATARPTWRPPAT